ncbi:MAG: DUF4386 domain-containing protein, partial [Actinomycetota bacterium]|nr:DUF4386 domain-containing protein [Actinomycetota bacterium]
MYIVVVGVFGELFVRGRLIVPGDAAATANNILDSETLFRVGLVGELLGYASSSALAIILYVLLKPVSRNLALLVAFLTITSNAVFGLNGLFHLAAVIVLGGAGPSDRGPNPFPEYLEAFDSQQLQALAYLLLRLHGYGFAIGLIFFGFAIVLLGHLIYRSGYLPRIIGVLLVIGGLGYLTNSFAQILAPALAANLLPWVLLPAFLGELGLALWLTVKGVNVPRW